MNLKDLVEKGYKVLGVPESGFYFEILKDSFRLLNISTSVEYSIVPDSWNLLQAGIFNALLKCNVTALVYLDKGEGWNVLMQERMPDVICHFAPETNIDMDTHYIFSGYLRVEMAEIANSLHESGILSAYENFFDYYPTAIGILRKVEISRSRDAEPIPFQMKDWKILSTFIALSGLLFLTCLIFVFEVIHARWDGLLLFILQELVA